MEKEFDLYTNKNEYRSMCEELDEELLKIKINDNNNMPKYDIKVFDRQLTKIENYYFNKLEYLSRKEIIPKVEIKNSLWNTFQEMLSSIRTKFDTYKSNKL